MKKIGITKQKSKFNKIVILSMLLCIGLLRAEPVGAASFAVAPMNNYVTINPGDSYTAAFEVYNPTSNTSSINYEVKMDHFYESNEGAVLLEEVGTTGEILDWATIDSPSSGTLESGESTQIKYTISVPENAPGGGQYLAFTVEGGKAEEDTLDESGEGSNTALEQKMIIAYRVFVEVTGDVIKSGEIENISVPGFLLGGNIIGTSTVKNTGNVHESATYKLQVFPLFSDEEVYTNEEDPETSMVLPDRMVFKTSTWENTPKVGIFNVIYTVEFAGQTAQISKMVIICPIWLLFIIFFMIAAIIIWLVMRARSRKSTNSRKASTE